MRFSTLSMAGVFSRSADLVPGTEVMATNAHMYSSNRGIGASGPVLVPQPSNHPTDPLNWKVWVKYMTVISQLAFVWVLILPTWAIAGLSTPLKDDFKSDQFQMALLSGIGLITLASSNVLLVPLSNVFGRRIVSILCGVLAAGLCVWQGITNSYMELLIARLCYGIVAATSQTIAIQVITDISFLHQRSFWIGAYFFTNIFASSVGYIIASSLAPHKIWPSFFWLCGGLLALATIAMIFMFPETRFIRKRHQSSTSALHSRHVSIDTLRTKLSNLTIREVAISGIDNDLSWTGRGLPCREQWWQVTVPKSRRWRSFLWRDLLAPAQMLFNPIIIWAGVTVMAATNLPFLFILAGSEVQSQPSMATPSAKPVDSSIAFIIGGLIGLATAGPLSDTWARRSTLRHGGIREAEMRLPVLLPYVLLYIPAHFIGGQGFQQTWPAPIVLIFGSGLAGLCCVSIPTIAISYAVDSYKAVPGEVMTVTSICKNMYAFGLYLWVPDLVVRGGWFSVFMVQLAIGMTAVGSALILYIWGKNVRRWTQDSIYHRLESFL